MNALEQSINSVRVAATAADGMKAEDVVAYNVGDKLGICDLMMIASASNERQVLAIAEEVEKQLFLKDGGRKPRSREGVEEAQWVLLDYGDFIIHIMHDEARDFYNLDACGVIVNRLTSNWSIRKAGASSPATPIPKSDGGRMEPYARHGRTSYNRHKGWCRDRSTFRSMRSGCGR